ATLKGAHDILAVMPEVVRETPRVRFVFVGEDSERIEERCVRGTPLAANCEFAGWKNPGEIAAYYADADVLLLPSQMEASSMALLEAMAAGLPVIASAVGAIPEILIPPGNGILIEAGDRAALAHAILALLRDAEMRRQIGQNNRAKAEAELGVTHFAASLGRVYDDVLARAADDVGGVGCGQPALGGRPHSASTNGSATKT
ncbi:MAG: glycosyltransferase family 4 protein, partial [Proteobacteria bacterium]|nr:glycosyltransferase family 4 protein [Pseudomonadota bacterium]